MNALTRVLKRQGPLLILVRGVFGPVTFACQRRWMNAWGTGIDIRGTVLITRWLILNSGGAVISSSGTRHGALKLALDAARRGWV